MSDRSGGGRARSRRVLSLVLLAAPVAALGSALATFSPTSAFEAPDPTELFTGNLQICHAAGGSGNYSTPPPANVSGIISGHEDHAEDIIPAVLYIDPLTDEEVFFPGLNWDAEGQAIYANDCVAVAATTTTLAPTTTSSPPTPGLFAFSGAAAVCVEGEPLINITFPARPDLNGQTGLLVAVDSFGDVVGEIELTFISGQTVQVPYPDTTDDIALTYTLGEEEANAEVAFPGDCLVAPTTTTPGATTTVPGATTTVPGATTTVPGAAPTGALPPTR